METAKKGQTIIVNSDLNLNNWSDLNPNDVDYILDLNGNTLNIDGEESYHYSAVMMEETMTIKNGVIVDQLRLNAKNIIFENVTFKVDYLTDANTPAIYWINGNVTFKNCKFETAIGRHLEGAGNANGTVTLTDCHFKAQPEATSYFNPLGAKGKIIMTGNTFESGIEFDGLYGYETKYTVTNNRFESVFGFTAPVVDKTELNSKSKTFCNSLFKDNNLVGTNKIKVYGSTQIFFVNAGF